MPSSSPQRSGRRPRSVRSSVLGRLASIPAGRHSKIAVLIGVIAVVFLASPLAGKIADVEDNDATTMLPRGAQSTEVEEELPTFDADGVATAAVVFERDGGVTAGDERAIADIREALVEYASDGRVASPTVADDGQAVLLTFGLQMQTEDSFDRFEDVRAAVDEGAPPGLEAEVTGPAAINYDSISVFSGVDGRILGASIAVVAVLLLLTYRSPVLWMVPLASIGVAMTVSQAGIYLLAKHLDLPVDGQSGGILPILVFGVGTDYALLLIARYREELHVYADRHRAMRRALRAASPAILASAATVVLGLSVLMLADINSTRSLGAVCAVGVAGAAVAMLTVLPMVLTLLGRWVFWPFIPRVDVADGAAARGDLNRWHGGWAKLARSIGRSPRAAWVASAAVLAALAISVVGLNVGTDNSEMFRSTPESVSGQKTMTEHFPAGDAAPADVIANADQADAVRDAIADVDGVADVGSAQQSANQERVRLQATLEAGADTEAAEQTIRDLRDDLETVDGADAIVGGTTAQAVDSGDAASRDARVVIPTVLAVVVVILMLLLRAVVGPLVLLGTVLLSYVAALGAGGLLMRAMGMDAVDISLPLLGFVFLVSLGVDYTIFLMSRVREEVDRYGHRAGVERGLVATGAVITSAGLVLAATFSVLAVTPTVFMIGLGVVVALGVLLDTFVVRSLLVPALALDIGERFWWPRRPRTVAQPDQTAGQEALTTPGSGG